ncbi:hypothetical protein Pyn_06196 [Prunus yedoensis var. nudiflora]|uniref:Uncharacterized protein n=1 Tax=Prunus yedoensis var. nudiflora TaxID=2094558 RepID=A0A314Y7C0_PRUYE|nr:hypothetical protein Pyn_06196 [Prunus yedoensis var. nudiflora]
MGSTIVDALCNVIAQHTPLVSYQTPMVPSSSGNNNVLYCSADLTAIPTENTIGCESSVTYLPLPPSAFVSKQSLVGFDGLQRLDSICFIASSWTTYAQHAQSSKSVNRE